MKFASIIISGFILLFTMLSCENLEELNENPNQPSDVEADVLMTSALRSSITSMVNESFLLGNNAAQLTAKTLRSEIDVYSWNAFPTVWASMYESMANVMDAENRARESGDQAIEGAAIVLRSWIFSVLTDAYGDIPYREAIKGVTEGNFQPAYDTQQEIYTGPNGILAELERANSLLSAGGAVGGDILFSGDVSRWQKLANSLRLRFLLRISNSVDVSAEFADIVANQPIMESNEDNAVLEYLESFPNEFPLLPLKQGDFDAVVMSDRSVAVMTSYSDPRLNRYARPDNLDFENPVFDGAENGSETSNCDKSGSRLGLAYFNYPGHPATADHADGIIMSYAELEFILAEGVLKGFIPGSVEDHYRNGIQASMDYYEVDYDPFGWADFDEFYTQSGVAYQDDPEQVWEQKWLALFFHGMEPYYEVRRWLFENNFDWDQISFLRPPCDNSNNDQLPVRFLYPGEESTLNQANYQVAIDRLGGSNNQNARMWLVQP